MDIAYSHRMFNKRGVLARKGTFSERPLRLGVRIYGGPRVDEGSRMFNERNEDVH